MASQNMQYQYDQLNCSKEVKAIDLKPDGTLTAKPDYSTSYAYDANGNLMSLHPNATTTTGGKLELDELE